MTTRECKVQTPAGDEIQILSVKGKSVDDTTLELERHHECLVAAVPYVLARALLTLCEKQDLSTRDVLNEVVAEERRAGRG